eukprot:Nk52_evm41s1810 gene=Nk52_evmTU41s1810
MGKVTVLYDCVGYDSVAPREFEWIVYVCKNDAGDHRQAVIAARGMGKARDLEEIQTLVKNSPDSYEGHLEFDKYPEKDWKFISAERGYVLPGLIDSHIHVYGLGRGSAALNLRNCKSMKEFQKRLSLFVEENGSREDKEWIYGDNWDQEDMGLYRYPNRFDLDAVCSTRPVALFRVCYHICVLNTAALTALGIMYKRGEESYFDKTYTVRSGGEVEMDKEGQPTGILKEAMSDLVEETIEQGYSREARKSFVKKGIDICANYGLTAVQTNDPKCWDIYAELLDEGNLPIRVFLTIPYGEMEMADGVKVPFPEQVYKSLLSCHRIKLFTDGSLGAETAALNEPYCTCHSGQNMGMLLLSATELLDKISQATRKGYRVEIHAIGDRAAEVSMDCCSKAGAKRPVLTHAQVLNLEIIRQMKSLDAVANVQPSFVTTDAQWAESRLGKERLQFSFAWKTLLTEGVHVAGGSDSPVEEADPLLGMFDSIFRIPCDSKVKHKIPGTKLKNGHVFSSKTESCLSLSWGQDQCLKFDEALNMYTMEGAYCGGMEGRLGCLRVGYLADMTILKGGADTTKPWNDPSYLMSCKVQSLIVNGVLHNL